MTGGHAVSFQTKRYHRRFCNTFDNKMPRDTTVYFILLVFSKNYQKRNDVCVCVYVSVKAEQDGLDRRMLQYNVLPLSNLNL